MRVRREVAIGVLVFVLSASAASGVPATDAGSAVAGDAVRSSQSDCAFPYETTDATGTTVRLPAEPERVVTLNPSAAQTMWEVGAREKVVGLTKYAGYLEGADARANVSGSTDIVVVEQVVALEPDLVLAPNATAIETVEQLRGAGITVYHFPEAEEIEDVYEKTRAIGRLTGACEGAEETVAWMDGRIRTVREAVGGERRPDVLYAFFGYTAGRGTFIHEVIEAAGGNNVAAEYGVVGYRQMSAEVVVEADPDWIVRNSENPIGLDPDVVDRTTAGRENRTVVVRIEHINQPAPRVVLAMETLAERFHPEAYAAANATGTATRTTAAEPTPTPPATTTTSSAAETATATVTETAGQPGFGVTAAMLAVAIASLAARARR